MIISSPGASLGVPSQPQGRYLLSASQPAWGAAAAEEKHSLRVPNNVCFASPLDKQMLTGFFLRNSRLPFPYIWGIMPHSVCVRLCDFDVPAPSSSPSFPYGEVFSPIHQIDVTSSVKPSLLTHPPTPEDERAHTDTEFSGAQLESGALALGYISMT